LPTARQASFEILQRWGESSSYAEDLIAQQSEKNQLATADRGFVNALVLGVLRNLSLLDHWIDEMRGRGKLKDDARDALRLGLYQILCMRVPDHAAVNETVSLVKKHARPIVNAILRRATRERDTLLAEIDGLPEDTRFSIPDFLISKWQAQFGDESTTALCEWSNRPAGVIIRANGLHPESASIIAALDDSTAVEGAPGFYEISHVPIDLIEQGVVYVQDPATALAPRLLDPQPGQRVLDACAAPGGKTALLADLMGNQGTIVATDRAENRCETMRENLARMLVKNVDVQIADWGGESDSPAEMEPFDAVLLDVPCSNTGVLRRRVDVRWRLYEGFTKHMCKQQRAILEGTAQLVKIGGVLVYSTCSIEHEENGELVSEFLKVHPEFTMEETVESLPHRDGQDGAFAARLRRQD